MSTTTSKTRYWVHVSVNGKTRRHPFEEGRNAHAYADECLKAGMEAIVIPPANEHVHPLEVQP